MVDPEAPNPLTAPGEARNRLIFRLLGPVEALRGDVPIELGGPLQRALLGCLLLRVGEVVSRERLIDDLWDEAPPSGAGRALETKVSRLRAALGSGALIAARAGGYVIEVTPESIDAEQFARLTAEAAKLRADDPAPARTLFAEAVALWNGEALGGVPDDLLRAERGRLEERRLEAIEDHNDLALELGDERAIVAELEALHAAHPLRERFTEQLMLAEYRAGRQSDALRTYRQARQYLVDELGVEPGPRLRELEGSILRQDASLGSPRLEHRLAGRARNPRVLAVAVAVAGVLLVAAVSVIGGGRATGDPEPGILLVDAATGKLRASVPVGDNLGSGRIGYGYAWSIGENGVVSQVNIRRGTLVRSIAVGVQGSLAVGAGGVWVTDIHSQTLTRIDPVTGNVNLRTPLPVAGLRHAVGNGGIAVYDGSLWITRNAEAVDRLDPATLHLQQRIQLRLHSCGIPQCQLAAGDGRVWVVGGDTGGIASIDASTNRIVVHARLDEPYACCVTVGGGSAWVAGSKSLIQLSPAGRVVRRIKVRSDNIGNVSFSAPYVWATADSTGELLRIDTRTGALKTFHFGNGLVGVAAGRGIVAVDAMPLQGNVTAGLGPRVLRIGLPTDWLNSTDPAMTRSPRGNSQWQWHLHDVTCAWLYRAMPDGTGIVRELAGVPSRSSDGLTWTIPVRRTLKFAPPVSRFVAAEDVRATIVRALMPQLRPKSPAAAALRDVVGLR
ncbi:MAG TPA: BTAD domain-containing putative transcriptional regulator, partial [Thermoleophilaceae bacterium]|nr:BTAD domain-containing putative transcriptional regulator [Thermoleophilaceae bacterium]